MGDYSRKFYIVYKGNYTHVAGLAFNTFLSNARQLVEIIVIEKKYVKVVQFFELKRLGVNGQIKV